MSRILAEVFGFPTENATEEAQRYRRLRLCPFNNRVPSCTKDKANDPLGVCSIFEQDSLAITCPVRFRENWLIVEDAARFFFPEGTMWTTLGEVRLPDAQGKSAGNIDIVLVAYDSDGRITDFGALEVQAVYISGNIRRVFDQYMATKDNSFNADLLSPTRPRPDYLSSSRKRLVPQLLYKGGILNAWNKRQAVALQRHFFTTLPELPRVARENAEIAWLVYDLMWVQDARRFKLIRVDTVYTPFEAALTRITTPAVGSLDGFISQLQSRLDEKLEGGHESYTRHAPDPGES